MEPTLLVVIATIVLTASGPSNTYAAKTWNDAITNLPCAAFKNTPDEWWITTGTITLGNGSQTWSNVRVGQQLQALPGDSTDMTITNFSMKDTDETRSLDLRCRQHR